MRLAVAPGYPQATTIGAIACSPDDADHDGRSPEFDGERVVWIGEGTPIGYLPAIARNALGHNWADQLAMAPASQDGVDRESLMRRSTATS